MKPELSGIPETMLWTLYNRAWEASRPSGCLDDPACVAICQSIEFDFKRYFGLPDGLHGMRSRLFDQQLRAFLAEHPNAVIINLGEGLETQRFRVPTREALWLSIDVPEAIAVRERFIQPDASHRHLAMDAFDTAWFDQVPHGRPCFISAQGLFMYFEAAKVAGLVRAMAGRFPGAVLMFDHLNRLLSQYSRATRGWPKTLYYRAPLMPWGIDRHELQPTLSRWIGQRVQVQPIPLVFPRGTAQWLMPWLELNPLTRAFMPGLCCLQFPGQPASRVAPLASATAMTRTASPARQAPLADKAATGVPGMPAPTPSPAPLLARMTAPPPSPMPAPLVATPGSSRQRCMAQGGKQRRASSRLTAPVPARRSAASAGAAAATASAAGAAAPAH